MTTLDLQPAVDFTNRHPEIGKLPLRECIATVATYIYCLCPITDSRELAQLTQIVLNASDGPRFFIGNI